MNAQHLARTALRSSRVTSAQPASTLAYPYRRVTPRTFLTSHHRSLHASSSRLASQSAPPPETPSSSTASGSQAFDAEELRRRIAGTPLEAVIKGNPEVVKAFERIGEVMRSKGIDTSTPPSKFTMLKLAMDSEFRTCLTDVMGHLKAAGVDVSPEAMQKVFGEAMQKK